MTVTVTVSPLFISYCTSVPAFASSIKIMLKPLTVATAVFGGLMLLIFYNMLGGDVTHCFILSFFRYVSVYVF